MDDKQARQPATRHIYLCCASADRTAAATIGTALRAQLQFDTAVWALPEDGSITARIEQDAAANDIVLILLSRACADTHWLNTEFGACQVAAALQDVTVLPVLIDHCSMPTSLAGAHCIDLRDDLHAAPAALREHLNAEAEYDFRARNALTFKEAVAMLFRRLGFAVQPRALLYTSDIDFLVSTRVLAATRDAQSSMWFVIARYSDGERISLSETTQLFYSLMTSPGVCRGLLVTNGQLTPIALGYANEYGRRPDREVEVLNGSRLGRLLAQHPDLVQRYFHRSVKQG
jgi:hypothetical protein